MSVRSAVYAVVLGAALVVGSGFSAHAHAALTGESPKAGSTVSEVTAVSVTANEELLDIGKNAKGFVLTVRDVNGLFYGDGCVSVQRDTATMAVVLGEPGTYRVAYRIISEDGHPVEGKFTFEYDGVAPPEDVVAFAERPECGVAQTPVSLGQTEEPTIPDEPEPIEPASSSSFDVIPWIGLATIPLIVGAIWVLIRLLGARDSEDHLT